MEPKIKLSIVTICFNDLPGLIRTYESLRVQSLSNFEWIVINGSSATDAELWLDKISAKEFSFTSISEPDDGIGDAWNKGILQSSGDYIVILNSGDIYYPKFLEKVSRYACKDKIICCSANIVNSENKVLKRFKAIPSKLTLGMHIPHNWCVVPRSLYDEFGLYSKRKFAMDYEWFLNFYLVKGEDAFVVVNYVGGEYSLEGVSDTGFIFSFLENAKIMNGAKLNKLKIIGVTLVAIIKHSLFRLLQKPLKKFKF